ncbi:HYC_CC_PP family protein [Pedobacter alpinus]|uniref:Phospholipase A2 n=1 Tax=Pedobacter alpinus TaxID=1590643 RepID=A0ABW5TT46_9SPHI
MKKVRHSLVLLLCLMVFITSSGMAVNLHYCAGELQNISLNANNKDCGMQQNRISTKDCDNYSQQSSLKKIDTCCQDHQVSAKTDNKNTSVKSKNETVFSKSFTFISNYFTSLFSFSSDKVEEKEEEKEISVFPLLKQGLYILLQQFRN